MKPTDIRRHKKIVLKRYALYYKPMEILTYGCAVNQSDSEIIHALLRNAGLEGKDYIVVNTCTVKTPTENKIIKKLKSLEEKGKTVIVAGCLPKARPEIAGDFQNFSFIGTNVQDIAEAVHSAVKGERYVNIGSASEKLNLPCDRVNKAIGIVQVSEGCLGACSYCQTKHARGDLTSYEVNEVVASVKRHLADGTKEIWLTSQDMGAYGKDIGESLTELINAVASIEGEYRVRVGMMNPGQLMGQLDELVDAYSNEKIYKFAHIPVQSGDNCVLKDMRRGYSVEEYMDVIECFKKIEATISTDLIVGYPTEDENALQNTLALIEEVKPDIVNITRFWQRPNTAASKLKQLPGRETKRRSRMLSSLFERVGLEKNKKWIGWSGRCLISSENQDGSLTCRNDFYKPIIIKHGKVGEWINAKVKSATYYDLRGDACSLP